MKYSFKSKMWVILIICVSISSSLYLETQSSDINQLMEVEKFTEIYMEEESFLPDVKIVKELLKSIFNVVKF